MRERVGPDGKKTCELNAVEKTIGRVVTEGGDQKVQLNLFAKIAGTLALLSLTLAALIYAVSQGAALNR